MATRTVRFGIKDQVLIRWYTALKEQGIKDITSILALAIEYHELTGKYIEIARVKLPDTKYEAVVFNMYFAQNTFMYDWFNKHHNGFQKAIRSVLNISITRLPEKFNGDELLATKSQLEQVISIARSKSCHTLDSIDVVVNTSSDIPTNTSAPIIPKDIPKAAVVVDTGSTTEETKTQKNKVLNDVEVIKKADKEITSFLQALHV